MSWLKHNKHIVFFIFLLVLSLPVVLPLFHKGFFVTDDGEWMIIRFSAFHEALRDGQLPVRFLGRLSHGYGYPVANFLYPGFMYLAEPIHLLSFGFVDTIKMIFGVSVIGSAVFCYFWLRKFFTPWAALIGSLAYLYAPYHLYDLYTRGSIGELLALAVIPFVLWQIERKSFFWAAVGVGALILAHNTLALLFLPVIIAYMLLDLAATKTNRRPLVYQYTSILVLGLGLAAFFWIPALYELQFTRFANTTVAAWERYFADVRLIGLPFITVTFIVLFIFLLGRERVKKHRLTILSLIFGVLSAVFASTISGLLWNVLPVAFIQFPFRFLSITIICFAFLSAFAVSILPRKHTIIGGALFLLLLFFSALPFLSPAEYFDKGDNYYATNGDSTTVKNEYMPKWVKDAPDSRYGEKVVINEGEIRSLMQKSNKLSFNVATDQEALVTINTFYFPGWSVSVNDEPTRIAYEKSGLIQFSVPEGEHNVAAWFSETPIRMVSDAISLLSFIILLFLATKGRRLIAG